jgi:hypothetical protein
LVVISLMERFGESPLETHSSPPRTAARAAIPR